MGLDAFVYCNCIETGKLLTPHPFPDRLYISENGSPQLESEDLEELILHNQWVSSSPCQHEKDVLMHHRLGNAGHISLMRSIIKQLVVHASDRCPLLWLEVIYSGTHTGDYLTPRQARKLGAEVRYLRSRKLTYLDGENIEYFQLFLGQLEDLIRASRQVNKPIAF